MHNRFFFINSLMRTWRQECDFFNNARGTSRCMSAKVLNVKQSKLFGQIVESLSCGRVKKDNASSKKSLAERKHEEYKRNVNLMEDFLKRTGVSEDEGLWVFGYGSLLWKVNFEYDEEKIGYIMGFVRRFWQGSTDHRGTAEQPGRVVTLVPIEDQNQPLWGIAYHIPPIHLKEALDILNFREKGGYSLKKIQFTAVDSSSQKINVFLYVAAEGNSDYGGDHELNDIALQISQAVGSSGPNREYLFNLAEVIRQKNLATSDDEKHTLELEKLVKDIILNNE